MATATINKTRMAATKVKSPTLRTEHARAGQPAVRKNVKKAVASVAGRFGVYGGRYVPETLVAALEELEREYEKRSAIPASGRGWTDC